jgi:hypothetical protein
MVNVNRRYKGSYGGSYGNKHMMLKTTALITTSQHAELAINVCKLLNPLLQTLREEWMRAFKTANDHQFKMASLEIERVGVILFLLRLL